MSLVPDISKIPPRVEPVKWNRRDVILYAVGIGETDLRFTYELSPGFSVLPTYPCVLRHKGDSFDVIPFFDRTAKTRVVVPGAKDGMGVHGEQHFELLSPDGIPPDSGDGFEMRTSIIGLYDAGKGMIQELEYLLAERGFGKPVARWISTQFVIGAGGFGGKKRPRDELAEKWRVPQRPADKVVEERTTPDQAIVYRLSGDTNPLHISPEYARKQFPNPILHGLCTFGFASRAVLSSWCSNVPGRLRVIRCRFSSPVYPGESLRTEMWDLGKDAESGRRVVAFETSVPERKVKVISNGIAFLEM
ncbi:MaoC-like dehydratase [Hyaloraphidium curvatum]|nr:MaoC-like dehydratase [Hyaloraphidium curvatum]